MTHNRRAAVRPRILTADGTEPLLLEDEIKTHLDSGDPRPLCILGGPGSGKSTALAHLASVFPDAGLRFLDEPGREELDAAWQRTGLLIYTSRTTQHPRVTRLEMAGWTEDGRFR